MMWDMAEAQVQRADVCQGPAIFVSESQASLTFTGHEVCNDSPICVMQIGRGV